jgi:hypothetical protein
MITRDDPKMHKQKRRKPKKGPVHIHAKLRARLEKYREPNSNINSAIKKVLGIIEGNQILIVVKQGKKIFCNK